jgi:hypothetical protein
LPMDDKRGWAELDEVGVVESGDKHVEIGCEQCIRALFVGNCASIRNFTRRRAA